MIDSPVILLAEDREDDVIIIRNAFARTTFPYRLTVVRDGEEAVAYLEGAGAYADRARYPFPSVLLLDLKMPRKDGFEVLDWIRGRAEFSSLRVVVLTSSKLTSDINQAYERGANSFLVKPAAFENYAELAEFVNGFWLRCNQVLQPASND
jgi:CheY-like chemotaxis protein